MNYNIKNKKNQIEQIESLENNSKIQNTKGTQTAPQTKPKKRNYTFSIDEELINSIDEFLTDFGERGESKSFFVEEALKMHLLQKKANIKSRLLDKIEKLNS